VADLARIPGGAAERLPAHEDAPADAHLAVDVDHVVDADRGPAPVLREDAEVGLVADDHGNIPAESSAQQGAQRDPGPAEVGRRLHEAVLAVDDARDRDADRDHGLGIRPAGGQGVEQRDEVVDDRVHGVVAVRPVRAREP